MLVKRIVLLFWAAFFTLVFLTNLADGLKALGLLPESFLFASGNYEFMVMVTEIYGTPGWVVAIFFAGVILWDAFATFAFWRAVVMFKGMRRPGGETAYLAFAVGTAFWAAFLIADEFFLVYTSTDLIGVHMRLLMATLLSALTVALLPENWRIESERRSREG